MSKKEKIFLSFKSLSNLIFAFELFNNFVKPDGINLDSNVDPLWARDKLKNVVIQGGLDPKELLKSEFSKNFKNILLLG